MMWRVGERLRASWSGLLQGELDGVREELTSSWTSSFDELRRDIVSEREVVDARVADHDLHLVDALHRVADAFENIAQSLEADRRARQVQLDTVEFLLRELVLGLAQPTATPPVVLGGSIDPGALADGQPRRIDIDLSDAPIAVGAIVEVRSRFHDRWVHGFAVSEYIPGPTRRGYRLRRITDTDQLPLLFDAADVRRATVATDVAAADEVEEPEPSMWR
jgi:hypothetical protein